jgi:N-acetylneuraminic acid mutarotase
MRILPTLKYILLFSIVFSAMLLNTGYGQGRWDTISSPGFTPRHYHACVAVNSKIYLLGGNTVDSVGAPIYTLDIYDPITDTWSSPNTTGEFMTRRNFTADVINGKIYVLGGYNDSLKQYCSDVSVFDPGNNSWSTHATTGDYIPRVSHTSAVINDKIYVIGGWYSGGIMNTIDVFDPASDTWSQLDETGDVSFRFSASAAAFNNKIYVAGGRDFNGSYVTTVDEFDISKNEWRIVPTIGRPASSSYQTAQFLGGKMYILGGHYGYSLVTKFKSFDPLTDSVALIETTGTYIPRYGLSSCVLNGKIYITGGKTLDSTVALNEIFTPANLSAIPTPYITDPLSISPNPATDHITIHGLPTEKGTIWILNVLGEKVLETTTTNISDNRMDISTLPPGVYFIILDSGTSKIVKRFVRQ